MNNLIQLNRELISKKHILWIVCLIFVTTLSHNQSSTTNLVFAQASEQTLTVVIENVDALDCFEPGTNFCSGNADFYSITTIDGERFESETIFNEDSIEPFWAFFLPVSLSGAVTVQVDIFDQDNDRGNDPRADLDGGNGRSLNLNVDLNACSGSGVGAISGDVSGNCGSTLIVQGNNAPRAEVKLRVFVGPPPPPPQEARARLVIDRIIERSCMEGSLPLIGCLGDPDFYAVVTIDGEEFPQTPTIDDDDDITPGWEFFKTVQLSDGVTDIKIEVFDEDGGLRFDDDRADLDPGNGRNLDLIVDIAGCIAGAPNSVGGDVTDRCGRQLLSIGNGDDRAEIRFRIEMEGPPPPPVGETDLVVTNLEITQAIQDLNNSVRLVAGKRTFARMHVLSTEGAHFTYSRLRLHKISTGETVWVEPYDVVFLNVIEDPDRAILEHAYLFEIPTEFTFGNIQVTGQINPLTRWRSQDPLEVNYSNNSLSSQVRFESVPPLNLVLYGVGYGAEDSPTLPAQLHRDALQSWLERAYPISEIQIWNRTYFHSSGVPTCDGINSRLKSIRIWNVIFGSMPFNARYYGLVDDSGGVLSPSCADGIPSSVASGATGSPLTGNYNSNWDTDQSYGDWLGGHELGHAYGRYHAEFCGAKGGRAYPYAEGKISGDLTGPTALFGFDIETLALYNPETWTDFMTYCQNNWVSDFTYENLMNTFQDSLRQQARLERLATSDPMDRLVILGTINPETNELSLDPIFVIPDATDLEPNLPGDYSIILYDAFSVELAKYSFTPDEIHARYSLTDDIRADVELLSISELVPFVAGTVRVDIESPEGLLGSVAIGASPPDVTLVSPNGGETIADDSVLVSWEANDADNDELRFNLQYSSDNGLTWEMVAVNLSETQIYLDGNNLPAGDESLFRVWVTDGINTTSDVSDAPFTIPNHLPEVEILRPLNNTTLTPEQTLYLKGRAYDIDLGTLSSENLVWDSNRDGILGNGDTLTITGLSKGIHTISLRADDGNGGISSDSVQVIVVDNPTLLPIANAAGPYVTNEGLNVRLNASASTSSNGSLLNYAWDFDNDGLFDDAVGEKPQFEMVGQDGTHTVHLRVTDNNDYVDFDTTTIVVNNVSPTVEVDSNAPVGEGLPVTLSGQITDRGWLEALTATVNWGDGFLEIDNGTIENVRHDATLIFDVEHIYPENGTYPVETCGQDNVGAVCETLEIEIVNLPPTIIEPESPQFAFENEPFGLSIEFLDSGIQDTHTATIDWGDGTITPSIIDQSEGSGIASGSHTYSDIGNYLVTVTISDDDGGISSITFETTVVPGIFRYCVFGQRADWVVELGAMIDTDCGIGGNGRINISSYNDIGGDVISYGGYVEVLLNSTIDGDIESPNQVNVNNAHVCGNVLARGDVNLWPGTHICGDVYSEGQIIHRQGAVVSGMTVAETDVILRAPVTALAPFAFEPATEDVVVLSWEHVSLDPGQYGKLITNDNGEVQLSSGEYTFSHLEMRTRSTLYFDLSNGPVVINIDGHLLTQTGVEMVVISNSGSASDILFQITQNVTLGKRGQYLGTYLGPESRVVLAERANLIGALYGSVVFIEDHAVIQHEPALKLYATLYITP